MKRALFAVLAVLLCMSLASCITINIPSSLVPDETTGIQTDESTDPVTAAPEDDTTGTEKPDDQQTPAADLAEIVKGFDATLEETVILDEKDVKITATGLRIEDGSAYLSIKIENDSDRKLNFMSGTSSYNLNSINGYMMSGGYLYETLEGGGSSGEYEMKYGLSEVIVYGIRNIAQIGTGFRIIEDDLSEYLETGPITIRTSADANYDYSLDSFARVMENGQTPSLLDLRVEKSYSIPLNNDYITIDSLYLVEKGGSPYLFIELRNKTDKELNFYLADVSVNGLLISSGTWYSNTITGGKKSVLSIAPDNVLKEEYRNALGIDSFSTVDFRIDSRDFTSYGLRSSDEVRVKISDGAQFESTGEVIYSDNKITIRAVALIEDPSEYYDDLHLLLVAKNDNSFEVEIDDGDLATVNGKEVDCYMQYVLIGSGKTALMDIELDGDDLEENGLDLAGITEVKVKFEIDDDNYDVLDEPEITYKASK